MRVLVLQETPGGDAVATEFAGAAGEFNRGLDIRLRFLEVGFEVRRLAVADADEGAGPETESLFRRFQPSVVLVLGRGSRLLECVATAAKLGARIAFLLNGGADRTAAAIALLSQVLVAPPGTLFPHVPAADRRQLITDRDPWGPALVRALVVAGRGR